MAYNARASAEWVRHERRRHLYRVTVSGKFSAIHQLRMAPDCCEPAHRHDWWVEVSFVGRELDSRGILVDFVEARQALDRITAQLDDTDLNECPLVGGVNPSAEHVARVICEAMTQSVSRPDLLESVGVEEAPGCKATFYLRNSG